MIIKALVTGGNGYVGSHLILELLRSSVEVHAIANCRTDKLSALLPESCIHPIGNDIRAVTNLVTKLAPGTIYHLATVYKEPPDLDDLVAMLNSNIALGAALLYGASRCDPHPAFVNLGTYWQFGDDANAHSPNTFYAASKQAMHDLLVYFRHVQGIHAVTLVLYEIFGPDDPRPKLWTQLAKVTAGSTFPVTEGRQYIELVHVDDTVRAILFAAKRLTNGSLPEPIYSVRSENRMTLRTLLEEIHDRAGMDIRFEWGAIKYLPSQIFSPWITAPLPGWEPNVSPVEGIVKLLKDSVASRPANQASSGRRKAE
jgi:nucleoside-diphosphate-sugar epimerase